jgi:hypothetical protein
VAGDGAVDLEVAEELDEDAGAVGDDDRPPRPDRREEEQHPGEPAGEDGEVVEVAAHQDPEEPPELADPEPPRLAVTPRPPRAIVLEGPTVGGWPGRPATARGFAAGRSGRGEPGRTRLVPFAEKRRAAGEARVPMFPPALVKPAEPAPDGVTRPPCGEAAQS